ncbi:MAG: hypothetical protein NVS9B4_18220 [Candidatus Acidiferrum sp.]
MLNIPAPAGPSAGREAQWTEARSVFPIYLALAKQLKVETPFPPALRALPESPSADFFNQVQTWLDHMDQLVMVHQLRHLLQMTTLNASESGLRALIHRHLRKVVKTNFDRDKIDFLLVQYFALCAPAKIYHKQIELLDVAEVLKPVLGAVKIQPLPWFNKFETMIESLRGFRSMSELLMTDFIEQGRRIKESSGESFYDPSALLAFVRFNFLLRRTLIELMHADLIAIRSGLAQLDAGGVRVMSCASLGFTAAESVHKIRKLADEWKQPFQGAYTQSSVGQTFEKLQGLRADVEEAIDKLRGKVAPATVDQAPIKSFDGSAGNDSRAPQNIQAPPSGAVSAEKLPAAAPLDFESCMEKIWEQLIATPPARGRSMTTIKIGELRLLMSSWEVAAFVTEQGAAAEDLRTAVVVRVLVSAATETAKATGDTAGLRKALSVARSEVSRLQERVDAAKKAKDTEAAVNLGISTKRLLSALDEAEKL